ncbi:MAG TPA: adenylate kinase [Candidatus Dormibacteraeota bacterium]|jgi:adenylate kinase family enzyme|nr:adenylate kinase [Candidatus Dormibacteraeota bacterium]
MRRVSIVGASGSGKTSFGRALAGRLGVPFLELDHQFWGPNWTSAEPDVFRERVRELAAGDGWVIDGNYSSLARPLVWDRADTVVWLDLPRLQVLIQVVWRTFRRALLRTELWHGNREPLGETLSRRSIVLWSWNQHPRLRRSYPEAMRDARWSRLRFVRLRSHREARRFLAAQPGPDPGAPSR